jgi:predicted oxidoreductase
MEDLISTLHRERVDASALQNQINDMNEKLIEKTVDIETATANARKREQELLNENRKLAEALRQYKKKALQLETFRRVVVDTIKNEGDFESTNYAPEKDEDKSISFF